jgi:hypothetical protein
MYSLEDSIFIVKHLTVVYMANPATREKGKGYVFRLLELMPSVKIVDMFVSDEIDGIFALRILRIMKFVKPGLENPNPWFLNPVMLFTGLLEELTLRQFGESPMTSLTRTPRKTKFTDCLTNIMFHKLGSVIPQITLSGVVVGVWEGRDRILISIACPHADTLSDSDWVAVTGP